MQYNKLSKKTKPGVLCVTLDGGENISDVVVKFIRATILMYTIPDMEHPNLTEDEEKEIRRQIREKEKITLKEWGGRTLGIKIEVVSDREFYLDIDSFMEYPTVFLAEVSIVGIFKLLNQKNSLGIDISVRTEIDFSKGKVLD